MEQRERSPALGPRHDSSTRVGKPESAADKMAALKARVAAAIGSSKASAKGGLNVGLHPALEGMGQFKPAGRSAQESKPSSQQQQQQQPKSSAPSLATYRDHAAGAARPGAPKEPAKNPYFDESTSGQGAGGKQRQSRQLVFNEKGKYIQQGVALRRQAQLEEMKKRIAATTMKAGIEEDLDSKQFVVEAPPEVEWWDEGLVSSYDDIDKPGGVKIGIPDSIVTEYIQHPVMLQPPQDRLISDAKPVRLTKLEQKKMRRQRRMRDLKEEQAKQRLGLIPAPPPKVKKGNLMTVLASEAVKDPTAVEARVNKEIQERLQKHLNANQERKLTKEQQHDKLAANQEKDESKGIHMLVFKIGTLANGQHRYKIQINAEQHKLTGVCIMYPKWNLVVVEGGQYSIIKYKKLMLNRIDWTENGSSRNKNEGQQEWLQAENENGELKDLSLNTCTLLFEGEVKQRAFRKWSSKVCVKEADAREVLARAKLENLWALAKGS